MDKIWYRNPSKLEVIGRCGGDEKKRMTTQNRQKSNAKLLFFKLSIMSCLIYLKYDTAKCVEMNMRHNQRWTI